MNFYPKWDYTKPEQTKEVVTGEGHSIPSGPPYEVFLRHIPREQDPSTVIIDGFTETDDEPGPGEFRVLYGPKGFGRVEFNAADAETEIEVDYNAAGSVVWAESYPDGRRGITHLQEELSKLILPSAKVVLSTDQLLPSASVDPIIFDDMEFDTDGMWDSEQEPTRLVILQTGLYVALANLSFQTDDGGSRTGFIRVNGDPLDNRADISVPPSSGIPTRFSFGAVTELSAGDYVEVFAYQNSGEDLNLLGAESPSLTVHGIRRF